MAKVALHFSLYNSLCLFGDTPGLILNYLVKKGFSKKDQNERILSEMDDGLDEECYFSDEDCLETEARSKKPENPQFHISYT